MPVYFIRAGDSGPVKIGRAIDVAGRLAELQTAHYEVLHLIREVEGGAAEERWFHRHFHVLRIRREWFLFDATMLSATPPRLVDVPPAYVAPILSRIEQHLTASGESAALFGRRAVGDPCFVYDLRKGREPRQATIRKALGAIPDQSPESRSAA